MSDEAEARASHLRAIVITTVAALAGVGAAIASAAIDASAGSTDAQLAVLAAVFVQIPVYTFAYDDWGGAKDTLYVAVMTFIMWFVTWGIILTSGAEIV